MASWKAAKEDAVTNHDGSSVLDVLTISAVAPLCFGLRLELARRGWSGALLDVAVVVAPLAFVLTTGCDAALAVARGAGACLAVAARGAPPPRAAGDPAADVRLFRCGQALATSVCILAVDFPAFPRRFCKTETFGVSLMDAGAGSFAFGNGLASRAARGRPPSLRRAAPLAALALLRAGAVWACGYPEHVTEYGAHWNFFATAAAVDVAGAVSGRAPPAAAAAVCAAAAAAVAAHAGPWVLSDAPRDSLVAANREGLASLPGYACRHFSAVARNPTVDAFLRRRDWPGLAALSGACFAAAAALGPPSRRLANPAYCAVTVGLNVALLAAFARCNRGVADGRSPLLAAVDGDLLAWFLVANATCGLLNLAVDTLAVESGVVAVLCARSLCDYGAARIVAPYRRKRHSL